MHNLRAAAGGRLAVAYPSTIWHLTRAPSEMVRQADKLPKFDKPPVVEVAIAVQFPPLQRFTAAHLGLVWKRYRDRFPTIEQHPPGQNRVERIGLRPVRQGHQITLSLGEQVVPRIWMITTDNCELIQVQSDRFARNWRRYHDHKLDYPTFAQIRPAFVNDLAEFRRVVAELGFGELVIDQCEVTYVNHIRQVGVWEKHSQLDRVFVGWSAEHLTVREQDPESIACRVNYQIVDDGKFVGRLFVEIDSQYVAKKTNGSPQTEFEPIFGANLVARGQPIGEGEEGVMRFIDLGHEVIVKSFAEVTTKAMHTAWGRTQ